MDSKENYIKQSKSKSFPGKANGISFWGFLLSVFIYISVFYVFKLSPMALVNTTKFWFFISNTLILIIAADFGAFSSSTKSDYYEEYANGTPMTSTSPSPSFESQYLKMVEEKAVKREATRDQKPQEKIKDVIVVKSSESPEKKLEIIVKDDIESPVKNHQDEKQVTTPKAENDQADLEEKFINSERKCIRSKSDKLAIMAEQHEKKIQRSQSERYDPEKHKEKVEENDFSTMSDEELNRRVEEFIRNFNRQIRLQAVRSRQNLHAHEV